MKSGLFTLSITSALWVACVVGCGEPTDRPSQVNTLRVLAARAENPFAKPGATTQLSLLSYDGSPRALRTDGSLRNTSTLWLSGCTNPPGDAFEACMPYLHSLVAEFAGGPIEVGSVPANVPLGTVGWGPSFVSNVPADIVTSRPVAPGVTNPYGVQMVFFAYCGGTLARIETSANKFPLGCFDAETGQELGRDDFEFGFYPLYSYDTVENANPIINSLSFDSVVANSGTPCSDTEPCGDGYHCGSQGLCIPAIARCTKSNVDDCESHSMALDVSRDSVESAVLAHVPASDAVPETLWVSYYATSGSFEHDSRVINDPHSGWNSDTAGRFRASVATSQEVRLWAVVRDDRNGVAWVEQSVWVD